MDQSARNWLTDNLLLLSNSGGMMLARDQLHLTRSAFDRYPFSPKESRRASLGSHCYTKSIGSSWLLTIRAPVDVLLRLASPANVL